MKNEKICHTCGGDGWTVALYLTTRCCNNLLSNMECCGNGIPVEKQTQEPCEDCQGTGYFLEFN